MRPANPPAGPPVWFLPILILAFTPGCSPDSPLAADPVFSDAACSASNKSYEDFGAAFFGKYCLRCHSVSLEDDLSRLDAPKGINFDTITMAREFKKRIRLRAGELGDMPPRLLPVPAPSEEERIQLIEWIDCGMKSDADQAGG